MSTCHIISPSQITSRLGLDIYHMYRCIYRKIDVSRKIKTTNKFETGEQYDGNKERYVKYRDREI